MTGQRGVLTARKTSRRNAARLPSSAISAMTKKMATSARHLKAHEGAEERDGDHQADQQRAHHGEDDRGVDELQAAIEIVELGVRDAGGRRVELGQAHDQEAPAVGRDGEAVGQHVQQRADGGEQEHRRDRQLDDVGDVAERPRKFGHGYLAFAAFQ